ncbi:predicted protein [Histoplasma mississippiense (nom. inval.)]|uniref:predicted protein n=1 Tax=Ajellomyces capsulatus (strain NAm1 / WU24) TaxID=2059318 RepID=UPI000157CB59|nr:predicted protein [Histoplasma mississippiense (nom. inval.)]EDN10474.1 predicted protein [Histoplasma mississippiense (nom. inval.)]
MPPNEAIIEQAIAQLNRQLIPKYAEVAKEFGINRITLMRRFKGQQVSRTEATSIYCQNLTNTEEQRLLFHINLLSDRGFPVTPQILRNFVFEITKMQLQEKIKQYNILPQNTYNFDEKGFLLGLLHTLKRIVSIEALKQKHTIGAVQDGSREFISLLASICADGTTIPPALIYRRESRDMQDTWLEDFDPKKDQAYFAASENGWNPARVLKKIQPRPLTPPELLQQRTPTSIRSLQGLIKQASQRHRRLSVDIKKILRAGENIALDREVLLIENKNLQTALNNERRRRKRGKHMGLLNPSNPSLAQFFSPTKVQAAREQADANETAKINDQARKEDMKLQRAVLREQKQAELMERKEQREKERLEAAQRREEAKAAAAAKNCIEKQRRDEQKLQLQKEKEEHAAKHHEAQLAKKALAEASKRPTRRSTVGSKHRRSSIQPSKSERFLEFVIDSDNQAHKHSMGFQQKAGYLS